MADEIRNVTRVYARVEKVICPHCDADIEGAWFGDPRGGSVETCDGPDGCGGLFRVDSDAEVRLV